MNHIVRDKAERTFVVRTTGTREYLVNRFVLDSKGNIIGPAMLRRPERGDGVMQAETWSTREAAERAAADFYRPIYSGERGEVVTLFEAIRDDHTYVFAHGRMAQYRFGRPTDEAHVWSIFMSEGRDAAFMRQQLGTIIVPDAVAATWLNVQHAGRFKYVEVYGAWETASTTKVIDARPSHLGFPFLLRDVIAATEPA